MKKLGLRTLLGAVLAIFSMQAHALLIIPDDCDDFGGSISCDTGNNTDTGAIVSYIEMMYGVTELYKSDQGGGDSGAFANSYDTTFANTPTDPQDALITYSGGPSISCPDCYVLVKDGNHSPAWYLYDISTLWDGLANLDLQDFWPNGGAISHVSIFGNGGTSVAAPGPLVLLVLGLIGLGLRQRIKIK